MEIIHFFLVIILLSDPEKRKEFTKQELADSMKKITKEENITFGIVTFLVVIVFFRMVYSLFTAQ